MLELGCASGGNLIPMAFGMPGATFVGIDLSVRQIEEGQAMIKELGLRKIELRHRNIADLDAAAGQFDYIVCHGIYSWRSRSGRKFSPFCRDNPRAARVAYVSYNTLPRLAHEGMVRGMMVFHVGQFDEPSPRCVRRGRCWIFSRKATRQIPLTG